ncbi:MAG TPA: hypothetical protein VGL63_02700 [Streptosporangiaceae bacterium]|jgi:ribonuclease BN (tRNA processing enzyme)
MKLTVLGGCGAWPAAGQACSGYLVELATGPFGINTWLLPHRMPNAGLRLTAGGQTLGYTGDTGPSDNLADLARDADLFLAEATYATEVPADSARQAYDGPVTVARPGIVIDLGLR